MVTPIPTKTMIIKSLIMIMIIKIHLGENLLAQAKAPAPRRATPPVATAAMLEKGRSVIFVMIMILCSFSSIIRITLTTGNWPADESHDFVLKSLTIRNLAQKGLIS